MIEVPSLPASDLTNAVLGEDSQTVRQRVLAARERQMKRQGKTNDKLNPTELDSIANIEPSARTALGELLERLNLSARSFHRILRVARTIADLSADEWVNKSHIMRAVSFRRSLDEK